MSSIDHDNILVGVIKEVLSFVYLFGLTSPVVGIYRIYAIPRHILPSGAVIEGYHFVEIAIVYEVAINLQRS